MNGLETFSTAKRTKTILVYTTLYSFRYALSFRFCQKVPDAQKAP